MRRGRHLQRQRLVALERDAVPEVRGGEATYTLTEGDALEITHHGDRITIEPDEPLTIKVPPAPHRPEPTQPPGRAPMRRRFQPR